jgi:Fe-S cluster assembly protein SufD
MTLTETVSILSAFEAFKTAEHSGSGRIETVTAEAKTALEILPIPGRKTEAWKYTPVTRISAHQWLPAKENVSVDLSTLDIPHMDAYRMVFVDGYFRAEYSDELMPEQAVLMPMSKAKDVEKEAFESVFGKQADHQKELFISLNTAFATDGIFLKLKKNAQLDKPVHVIHVYTQENTAVMTRNIVIAEQGSKGEMIHSSVHNAKPIHSNVVTEVRVEDNAHFVLDKLQGGTDASFHYSSEEVFQGRDATCTINTVTIAGAWTRNEPHIRLKGSNSICYLNGAYFPIEKEHVDNHTVIDHLVPNCESHELYKGVVYEQSKGVFNGKVFVRPDAQKTNAFQQNANIVMSNQASMNSKPELEIYADDVKCSHGSTTGQLDTEALFYLQCRGLSRSAAKQMLVSAFVGEVIDRLSHKELRAYVWRKMEEKLDH